MCGLLRSLPFVLVYLCENMGPRGLLPATLPARFSTTLSPALSVYLCENIGPQGLLVVRLLPRASHTLPVSSRHSNQGESSPPWLPVSAPPTRLDECLFFISLVLDFLARLIFCQFWLCEEVQCVYLCLHLGSSLI